MDFDLAKADEVVHELNTGTGGANTELAMLTAAAQFPALVAEVRRLRDENLRMRKRLVDTRRNEEIRSQRVCVYLTDFEAAMGKLEDEEMVLTMIRAALDGRATPRDGEKG